MTDSGSKKLIAAALCNLGVSADFLTGAGLLLAALSGWLASRGDLLWAAAALLASGLIDMMDGAVARVSGKQSPFGGILDSSLDRYGDAFVFLGLCFYFLGQNRADLAALTLSAWTGAFLISYVRARSECEGRPCRVGFWERGERIGVLVLALAAGNAGMAAWILGTATHWTVLQRLYFAARQTGLKTPGRREPAYVIKIALLAALILFLRVP